MFVGRHADSNGASRIGLSLIHSNLWIDHALVFRVERYRRRNGALVRVYRQQVGLEVIRVLHVSWMVVWVRLQMKVERVGWAHEVFL